MSVYQNYVTVKNRLKECCQASGRPIDSVKLLPVSKFQDVSKIEELLSQGVTEFGENYVQELCEKSQTLQTKRVGWHMIGHLQRNKVKALLKARPVIIESVDSLRLAECIQKEASEAGLVQNILLQVNSANEENKTGLLFEEVLPLAEQVAQMPNLCLKGLMVVAPIVENPEEIRPFFHRAGVIYEQMKKLYPMVDTLSMGMTHDFEVAVSEGSTQVRVGTAIFGARVQQE